MSRPRVAFLYQAPHSYIMRDLAILRERYEVHPLQFHGVRDLAAEWALLRRCDASFSWFGKLHALAAVFFGKLSGKRACVIAGGDDVACEQNPRYGLCAQPWKRWLARGLFRGADAVLAVSDFNLKETWANAWVPRGKAVRIWHGFDGEQFFRPAGVAKERAVLTVGRITEETILRKGLRLFVQAARLLPEVPFWVAGSGPEGAVRSLKSEAPSNVRFFEGLADEEIRDLMARAKVYAQPSRHEAFGCAVAEAMLCECIPVVSRRAALPEVAGDCGVYAEQLRSPEVARCIGIALRMPEEAGSRARRRILEQFPLEKRRTEIWRAMEGVLRN